MTIAIWIIAICELVRLVQNTMQLKQNTMQLNIMGRNSRYIRTQNEFFDKVIEDIKRVNEEVTE